MITGIPGVGKSSIINGFVKENESFNILEYGNIIQEFIFKKYNINERNRIGDYATSKDVSDCDKMFLERICEETFRDLIIEAHGIVKLDFGYKYEPFRGIKKASIDGIVMIEASPKRLIQYRLNHDDKKRKVENFREIELHQGLLRNEVMTYVSYLEIPGYFMLNNSNLRSCIKNLNKIIREIKRGKSER